MTPRPRQEISRSCRRSVRAALERVHVVPQQLAVRLLALGVPFYGLNRQKNYPEPKSQHVEVLRFMTGQVARSNRIDGSFCTVFLLCHESKHSCSCVRFLIKFHVQVGPKH